MKKILLLYLLLFPYFIPVKAQLDIIKSNDVITIFDKYSQNGYWYVDVCFHNELNAYFLRLKSNNRYEDEFIIVFLGNDKQQAVMSLRQLVDIKKEDGNITIVQSDFKNIRLKYSMSSICIEQDGIAGYGVVQPRILKRYIRKLTELIDE